MQVHLSASLLLSFLPFHITFLHKQTLYLIPQFKNLPKSVLIRLFPQPFLPKRSKRPLLVFLSVHRKAFEKRSLAPEKSSTWTLTLESRFLSASSRRRTGATSPSNQQKPTLREKSICQSIAPDGKVTTLLFKPIFLKENTIQRIVCK